MLPTFLTDRVPGRPCFWKLYKEEDIEYSLALTPFSVVSKVLKREENDVTVRNGVKSLAFIEE